MKSCKMSSFQKRPFFAYKSPSGHRLFSKCLWSTEDIQKDISPQQNFERSWVYKNLQKVFYLKKDLKRYRSMEYPQKALDPQKTFKGYFIHRRRPFQRLFCLKKTSKHFCSKKTFIGSSFRKRPSEALLLLKVLRSIDELQKVFGWTKKTFKRIIAPQNTFEKSAA